MTALSAYSASVPMGACCWQQWSVDPPLPHRHRHVSADPAPETASGPRMTLPWWTSKNEAEGGQSSWSPDERSQSVAVRERNWG